MGVTCLIVYSVLDLICFDVYYYTGLCGIILDAFLDNSFPFYPGSAHGIHCNLL
jgi:hypothetical protein